MINFTTMPKMPLDVLFNKYASRDNLGNIKAHLMDDAYEHLEMINSVRNLQALQMIYATKNDKGEIPLHRATLGGARVMHKYMPNFAKMLLVKNNAGKIPTQTMRAKTKELFDWLEVALKNKPNLLAKIKEIHGLNRNLENDPALSACYAELERLYACEIPKMLEESKNFHP